ncbi:BPTI/Kunitz domain-containing protein [Nannocystis bainbridge]|uniref:BPTI/Kunitz domain-containing protein n=1 Tax=Nannocystis bainbridge TaxID=2995303 RepID=A0ABT5DZ95_9BACT|nr:BPTI/Kunitz domain-containing protein [Nannocystis bainbridge]MDC0717767.1 BPTI/Kunitz domain-containing protein [Nannocystis bainbridge]
MRPDARGISSPVLEDRPIPTARAALLACLPLACSSKTEGSASATTDPGTTQPESTSTTGTSAAPTSATGSSSTATTTAGPSTSTTSMTTSTSTGVETGPLGACALEPVTVRCDNFLVGYYFDPVTMTCKSFDHGECGGEVVPFETLADCLVACEGCETDCETSTGSSSGA